MKTFKTAFLCLLFPVLAFGNVKIQNWRINPAIIQNARIIGIISII